MNRLIASAGVAALMMLIAGCGNDQAAVDLADAKAKLNAAINETEDLREQLKKSQATVTNAITKCDDLTKRLGPAAAIAIGSQNESESNRLAVERLQRENENLKARLSAAKQSKKATETAESKGRDGDDPPTKSPAATDSQ
jgi:multidrug resistance efflux pump